ncbi:TRAP transporter small permease [Chloroflexota bacterium]
MDSCASYLEKLTSGFGVLLVLGMAGILFVATILRYVFNYTIGWSLDMTTFMLTWSVFIVIGSATRRNAHIRIGFFLEMMVGEKRARVISITLENVIGLAMCSFLAWTGYRWIAMTRDQGLSVWSTGGFKYPVWIPIIVVALGMGLAGIFYLERTIKQILALGAFKRSAGMIEQGEGTRGQDTSIEPLT